VPENHLNILMIFSIFSFSPFSIPFFSWIRKGVSVTALVTAQKVKECNIPGVASQWVIQHSPSKKWLNFEKH
jgi:hypothetical protein